MSSLAPKEIELAIARLTQLKNDLDADKRIVVEEAAELLELLRAEVARLGDQVKWLAGKPYRKKDEGIPPGQLALNILEMLKGRIGDVEDALARRADAADCSDDAEDPSTEVVANKQKRKRRGRELLTKVIDCRLSEDERACECCEATKSEMGFDAQRRFIYEPAKVYILEERRFKYACSKCQDGVELAPPELPTKPILGGMASSSLLAFIVVSKVLDGLPINRLVKILERHGVELSTSTLNDWFARVADMFVLVRKLLHAQLLECQLISLDDTPLKSQSRGHPNGVITGRQWLYMGNRRQVLYAEYTPDWKGVHPRRVLEGYGGDVQNDGYAGINPLFVGPGAPSRIGCNDHSRRKFVDALEQGDKRAQIVIDRYRAIYAIEAMATAKKFSVADRLAIRQAETAPLWDELENSIAVLAVTAGKKSPLGKAVTYFTRQKPFLSAFLTDGFLPISNIHVEQQIRTVGIFRKNSLFVGSVDAGERFAVILTMLLNCQLCGANPYDYMVDVIDKIAGGHPASRLAELAPRKWLELRQAKDQSGRDAAAVLGDL